MLDQFDRNIDYMRISITDRCNLRCRYCMPEGVDLVPMQNILSYEEIERIVRVSAEIGIKKIKITGGEPLVRKGCTDLIKRIKAIDGIEQVTMTTNGILLGKYASELKGVLDAVNISLDTLQRDRYQWITGQDGLEAVFGSIEAALEAGIRLKINSVLMHDVNEEEWKAIIELAKKYSLDVRFIEMMPIGFGKEYTPVDNEEILRRVKQEYGLVKRDDQVHGNGPAVYYEIPGFKGSIGFISAIHGKFCGSCNRVRLTSQGLLKPCLCYAETTDLKEILSRGCTDEELKKRIENVIFTKPKQHCFEEKELITEANPMVGIGG